MGEIRCMSPDELIEGAHQLINCLDGRCPLRIPRHNAHPADRRAAIKALQKILHWAEGLSIVMPVLPVGLSTVVSGSTTVVQSGHAQQSAVVKSTTKKKSSSSNTKIVRNVQLEPEVQKTVIEEHIHQPDPIVEVEKRTIVHQGGRTFETERTTVTQGSSVTTSKTKHKSGHRKYRTPSPETSESSSDESSDARSDESSDDSRYRRIKKKNHGRKMIKDRSESTDREDRRSKEKTKDKGKGKTKEERKSKDR